MRTKILIFALLVIFTPSFFLKAQFNFDSERIMDSNIPDNWQKQNQKSLYFLTNIIGNEDSIKIYTTTPKEFYIGEKKSKNRYHRNIMTDLFYDNKNDIYVGFIGLGELNNQKKYNLGDIINLMDESTNGVSIPSKKSNILNATEGMIADIPQLKPYMRKYKKAKVLKLYNKHCGIVSVFFIYNNDIDRVINDFINNKTIRFNNKCRN